MKTTNRFRIALAVFWLVSLAAIAVGLGWLWFRLEAYENATPEAAVRQYLSDLRQGRWEQLAAGSDFTPTELVTEQDYIAFLQQTYKELPEDTALVRTGEEGGSIYQLQDKAGNKIAALKLTAAPAGEKYAYRVQTRTTTLDPVEVEAPAGVQVLLGGRPLTEAAVRETVTAPGYEQLPDGIAAPQLVRYELEGLLQQPQLTAQDGYQVSTVKKGKQTIYEVTGVPSAAQQQEYRALAEKAAKTYAAFVTQDAGRGELNALLLPGTSFYKAIQQFYNGWYVEHTGHEYRNLDCSELELVSDNAFSAKISFDYVILRGSREYLYPSSYRLFFLNAGGGWKLARLDTL